MTMTETVLISDVGGTNARLALARDGQIIANSVTRFRGDDYASFDAVLQDFLVRQGNPDLAAACVAVAGPVAGGQARLTNRDWHFSTTTLQRATGADRVRLINDLSALGFATQGLCGDQLSQLRAAKGAGMSNGQALVLGAGTGVNVCAVKCEGPHITCFEAEEGHTALPATIMDRLRTEVGPQATRFASVEETFAGRGLAQLHQARTGQVLQPEMVTQAADQPGPARDTVALYSHLFGMLCRDLALRYLPRDGLFLAGSVARAVATHFSHFEQGFVSVDHMSAIPQSTPVYLIRDDMAALAGCLIASRG